MIDLETSIRDAIDEQIEKGRRHWIGGVPTAVEMAGIYRKVARALLIEQYLVEAVALKKQMEIVG